jgi:hypothetical protein
VSVPSLPETVNQAAGAATSSRLFQGRVRVAATQGMHSSTLSFRVQVGGPDHPADSERSRNTGGRLARDSMIRTGPAREGESESWVSRKIVGCQRSRPLAGAWARADSDRLRSGVPGRPRGALRAGPCGRRRTTAGTGRRGPARYPRRRPTTRQTRQTGRRLAALRRCGRRRRRGAARRPAGREPAALRGNRRRPSPAPARPGGSLRAAIREHRCRAVSR